MSYRFLVVDGYDRDGRINLEAAGCTLAGELYSQMAKRYVAGCHVDIAHPADGNGYLPAGTGLTSYDALLWTGSSLTIYENAPRVIRQIELARAAFDARVPSFGSCWALQVAVVAAGGSCRLNPNGREFGIARKLHLTAAGHGHPMYAGKPRAFDGFTSHFDEVEALPTDSIVLASNAVTRVQAAEIQANDTSFWAVQYHPEYNLREIAALARFRADGLIEEGRFEDFESLSVWTGALEALHENPDQSGLAWRLGIDTDLTDPAVRCREFRNWVDVVFNQRKAA